MRSIRLIYYKNKIVLVLNPKAKISRYVARRINHLLDDSQNIGMRRTSRQIILVPLGGSY